MGDVIQLPRPEPGDPEDLPFRITDAYGNECFADSAEGALQCAWQLQDDAGKALMTQGSGKQAIAIFFEGRLHMSIDRRIYRHEVFKYGEED